MFICTAGERVDDGVHRHIPLAIYSALALKLEVIKVSIILMP